MLGAMAAGGDEAIAAYCASGLAAHLERQVGSGDDS
jgi:hypothetical protein